jgi:fatty-acyl-CoA synthase
VNPETLSTCDTAVLDAHGRVRNAEAAVGEIVDKFGARDFEGYYRNDAADAERLRNGWYWTGDLGYVDGDGYLYFAGRRGDWIRVDGENTSALTIERVLRRHPEVIAAAVYAVPDPRSGDQVMAALEVRYPAGFDMAEFAEFLSTAADLGRKGVPQLVRLSTGLPVTGSGQDPQTPTPGTELGDHGDPVHLRVGRGTPRYRLMAADDRDSMDAEFDHHRRARR